MPIVIYVQLLASGMNADREAISVNRCTVCELIVQYLRHVDQ
ncbi:hypothetical protein SynSYN20_01042 [Synechococcus sp. SYN20]|nr:hypothetical protein SynSYN20_01042 [Synechococcus sp. SYN20]